MSVPGLAEARSLVARVVAVLDLRSEDRGLVLAQWSSRAIRRGEIHELIATDEPTAGGTSRVGAVAYLAFIEFLQGGVLFVGAELFRGDAPVGRVRGYDETHMPNHMNIVVQVEYRTTGAAGGWRVSDRLKFVATGAG